MKIQNHFLSIFLLSVLSFSCGGGGGGNDDGGGGTQPLVYEGKESPAIIDSNNAVDLAVDAFIGGDTDAYFGTFSSVQTNQLKIMKEIKIYEVAQILSEPLYKINMYDHRETSFAIQKEEDIIIGPCGGSMAYTVSTDDVTGSFNGSMTFSDYCDNDTTISGRETFNGQLDLNTGNFINFNINIVRVSLTSENQKYTIEGDLSIDESESSSTVSMDILMQDDITVKVYWVNDYTIIISDDIDYVSVDISGRFYDPAEGYVDLSTTNALRINYVDMWPSQGELQIAGDQGTKANLVCEDENLFHVIADTNGDGEFDYYSEQMNWNDVF